jgi:uncharacterized protein YggT (Ycf19 family)
MFSRDRGIAAAWRLQPEIVAMTSTTTTVIDVDRRAARRVRTYQIVAYVFAALYALIALEIALELLGANDRNAFKQLLDGLTAPFLAPFRTLLPDVQAGGYELVVSYVAALVVYMLLHWGVRRLIDVAFDRRVQTTTA